ncbi:hypothetical protein [Nocardioides pyridinolyticus]
MSTDLHEFLDRTLADLDVPTDRLREGALTRGRVVRRRRRAIAALGGVVVTALAAGLTLPSLAGTDNADDRIAHDTGDPSPDTYVRPAGWWDMSGGVMRDTLAHLLPARSTVTDENLGDEELAPGDKPTGGWVQVDVLDEGEPAGGMNVVLYPPFDTSSFAEDVMTCPGNASEADACTELGDGTGRLVRWETGGVVTIEATWLLPDGGIVYAAASNSSDDKWGVGSTTDRAVPPVRPAQLAEIAASPLWQEWTPRG